MPKRTPRPCRSLDCSGLTREKHGYCEQHKQQASGWTQWQKNKGNRHQRGYGKPWERLRKLVLERDTYLCQMCLLMNKYTPANIVDHIKPKSQGGDDALENLQAICRACHQKKTDQEKNHRR
ncbi:HNH endonuclease [Endozoicomonas sp. SM1973]|uniref:Putative HNH nuclease YajD n=1 Tax=Spartinivicinus marinus TaxID=2994442 RepID=A0A853IA47_9GAMM|nr:HNH endonuclease [Spartinivicinus marinus]NYZ69789.1 HNH endonuclease [Spartinivicinus marinus]